jgi:hypothetical protein
MAEMVARDDSAGGRASWPAYFTVFAIAMTIFLLAIPMMAVIKGYAGLARMCRPARSARGSSTVCTQAIEQSVKHPG